jgi:hypothetical protein
MWTMQQQPKYARRVQMQPDVQRENTDRLISCGYAIIFTSTGVNTTRTVCTAAASHLLRVLAVRDTRAAVGEEADATVVEATAGRNVHRR